MEFRFQHGRRLFTVLMALGFAASASGQQVIEGVNWTRPGVDLSAYDKILLKPLDISDVKVLKPPWEQDDPESWEFQSGSKELIQNLFWKTMTETISAEGGYKMAGKDGPRVLQLEIEFLSITPYIKPGSNPQAEGYVVQTLGSGDVVVSAELRDSVTGSLLALVEGERQIGSEYQELSVDNHLANLEATFATWGTRLREALDRAHNR